MRLCLPRHSALCFLVMAFCLLLGPNYASAHLVITDPTFYAVMRASGHPKYSMTVDLDGAIYFSTGTAFNDQIRKVAPNGAVTTIVLSNNAVVGTIADLEFGFHGHLYANVGFPNGVRRFQLPTGTGSAFYTDPPGGSLGADGGLAFDAVNQVLYACGGSGSILSLDANGTASVVSSTGAGYSLALESSGTLLSLNGQGVLSRIDPTTGNVSTVVDLGGMIADWRQFKSMDIHPLTGDVYFAVEATDPSTRRSLYRVGADGTNLSLIAYGGLGTGVDGPLNLKVGRSGDGSGAMSVYLGMNESQQILELRTIPVPEPSTYTLCTVAAIVTAIYARRTCRERRRHDRSANS